MSSIIERVPLLAEYCMINTLTLKAEGSVCYNSFKKDADDYKNEVSFTVENGSRIINDDDSLTLQEVYDTLIIMLNGDLSLVREVLSYSKVMVACGVRIAQESRLSKHDIYKMIDNLKSRPRSINDIRSLQDVQKDNAAFRKNRKQSRGRR